MSQALESIAEDFEAFRAKVAMCQSAAVFDRHLMDAHARLARVRDRYLAEKGDLTDSERRALSNTLENDNFIEGLLHLRQIGEHVTKHGGATITIYGNAETDLSYETSAKSAFVAREVTVTDRRGNSHQIDHLQRLREAEKRIQNAFRRARSSRR